MLKKPQIQPWYGQILEEKIAKPPLVKNCLLAFAWGGALCGLVQLADSGLIKANVDKDTSGVICLLGVIGLAALLTGLGVYDKLAQNAGGGLAVPISGFANSLTSAAMEHRSEGFVLGSGCNSFKLAGAVIVYGVFSGFWLGLIRLLLGKT